MHSKRTSIWCSVICFWPVSFFLLFKVNLWPLVVLRWMNKRNLKQESKWNLMKKKYKKISFVFFLSFWVIYSIIVELFNGALNSFDSTVCVISWKSSGIRIKTVKNCNTITMPLQFFVLFCFFSPLSHRNGNGNSFCCFFFYSLVRQSINFSLFNSNSHYHTLIRSLSVCVCSLIRIFSSWTYKTAFQHEQFACVKDFVYIYFFLMLFVLMMIFIRW